VQETITVQSERMADPDEHVLRDDDQAIARLTLNRPSARNALSMAMMERLAVHLREIGADRSVRAVIIAGAGPAFCSGHDLRELRANPGVEFQTRVFEYCASLMMALNAIPQPVIAEVHGIATAAGCQLVAACDLAIASLDAKFATPGVNIGLFCSTPMVALTRAVPRKAAMEMLLLGEMIGAEEAHRLGLVNRVVAKDALSKATRDLAAKIAAKSPHVLKIGKRTFYEQIDLGLAEAYAHTARVMVENMQAMDAAEGIDAFLGKRQPAWRGC
jgi:enoyl-CoA hydratase/carnithine racemase